MDTIERNITIVLPSCLEMLLNMWDSNKFDLSGFGSHECVHKENYVACCLCNLVVSALHLDALKTQNVCNL